jgi:hypothetical protein
MPDKRSVARGLLLVGGIAVAVALLAAFQMLAGGHGSLLALIPVVASLGCFGLLLGAIFVFDAPSEFRGVNRPLLRVALSAVAGLALGLLWRWSGEAIALSTLVAGALGYFGLAWARHVDF